MKLWEKIKSDAKIYSGANRQNTIKTGGGPSTIKIDPVLEQASSILGRSCSGIEDVDDCDACPSNINTTADIAQPILYDVISVSNHVSF